MKRSKNWEKKQCEVEGCTNKSGMRLPKRGGKGLFYVCINHGLDITRPAVDRWMAGRM